MIKRRKYKQTPQEKAFFAKPEAKEMDKEITKISKAFMSNKTPTEDDALTCAFDLKKLKDKDDFMFRRVAMRNVTFIEASKKLIDYLFEESFSNRYMDAIKEGKT